jgi:tetratricopeptide (TPR) repeat protein
VTEPGPLLNPFPGLRPFEPDEDYLFFGRERETDELLRQLRYTRFVSVVGTSGCGKSSLVRSGLIPSLHSGLMVKAGSSWRVSIFRPGEDPIGHLAAALDAPGVIGTTDEELASTSLVLLEAALRRGTLGLVDAVRQARIPPGDNLLVVVDQFEELFRFRRSREIEHSTDEAITFVKLLLEASSQKDVPIYVVLTMRSDFIGDCMEYPGLPEALNSGQYLVPRLTRDELRSAITGPVAVAGAEIAPRLVQRLLNDLGNDQDQLPVLQHALMRTWDHWEQARQPGEPIDISDYEAIGTLEHALSRHAEEAYLDTGSDRNRRLTERVFKALTDTVTDSRGVRRPASVAELARIAETSESEVTQVVDVFRRPGRSFLMPPSTVPLGPDVIVDLAHESLMRCWIRLIKWAEEERTSAAIYLRLTRAAGWCEEGSAGLWRDPELELGLRWKRENHPTAAWARRYDESFGRAMQFLDRSEQERDREKAERVAARRRQWRQLQLTAAVLAVLLVYAVWSGFAARRAKALAELNLRDARRAVDESLSLVDRDPASLGIDHPQIIEFRRDLAGKAQAFYAEFIKREPASEDLRQGIAFAHFRLGQINRILDAPANAAGEYRQAIDSFDRLARDYPDKPVYRQGLANAYNWLGETLRGASNTYADANNAYDQALRLLQELRRADPQNIEYLQELARTHSNRGILYAHGPDATGSNLAESDFREAIRLLEPLAARSADPTPSQELGRASNNLGSLLAEQRRESEARELYHRAVQIHEGLARSHPQNREYRLELAKFYNNLAYLLREQGNFDLASRNNSQALAVIDEMARPAPSLGIEQADGHNLRGAILEARSWREAMPEYRRSLELYQNLAGDALVWHLPDFHDRFGDLLVNLAALSRENQNVDDARVLLTEAVNSYLAVARKVLAVGSAAEAGYVAGTLSRALADPSDRKLSGLAKDYEDLQTQLHAKAINREKQP